MYVCLLAGHHCDLIVNVCCRENGPIIRLQQFPQFWRHTRSSGDTPIHPDNIGGWVIYGRAGGRVGGTDVVDLPDILLPAGQYLDLFDSESETDVPSDSSDEELVEV